jgi:hypothetical protein
MLLESFTLKVIPPFYVIRSNLNELNETKNNIQLKNTFILFFITFLFFSIRERWSLDPARAYLQERPRAWVMTPPLLPPPQHQRHTHRKIILSRYKRLGTHS